MAIAEESKRRATLKTLGRRPLSIGVGFALATAAVSALIFGGWDWMPLPLGVLTIALLAECVTIERSTVSPRLAATTAVVVMGLMGAVTVTADGLLGVPPERGTDVEVALGAPATTTPEVEVEGATLDREDYERLAVCETALQQIADAIGAAPGFTQLAPEGVSSGDTDELKLRRCEVRISAIASSLQP